MVTALMEEIRKETAQEVAAAVVAAVEDARRRHGINDPDFATVVCAGIGFAIDELGMIPEPAVRALGQALIANHDKGGSEKRSV